MKFAEKYEILEMVTSGRVSTFLARERTTQEAVVVYTFECPGTGAELSTASIIARFCSLAPNPPGIIVKAGFDQPSSAAFITTKMPDPAALKAWMGAYHSFARPAAAPPVQTAADKPVAKPAKGPTGEETAELSAFEVREVLARSGPAPKQPPVENIGGNTAAFSFDNPVPAVPQSAGEFTRLFREVNAFQPVRSSTEPAAPASAKPSNATDAIFGERLGSSPLGGEKFAPAAPPPTPGPVESSSGSFTREFLGISSVKAEPTPTRSAPPPGPPEKEPGAFTREFMAVSQDVVKHAEKPSGPVWPAQNPASCSPPAATYDSIFGAPSQPASSAGGAAENQKSGTGEFTSFFRDPFEHPGAASKSIAIPDLASSAPTKPPTGEFTRVFGKEDIQREEPSPMPLQEREQEASPGSFTQMFGEIPAAKATPGSQLGAATLGTNPNVRPSFPGPSGVAAAPADPPRGAMSSTPVPPPVDPFFSRTPPPVAPPVKPTPVNQMFMNRPGSPTDVFRMPGGDAPPVEPAPSGPSEFTVFLSRSQVKASFPPEPAVPSANPAGSAQLPALAPPPPPALPPNPFQFAPPPPPPPPAMKYPAMPAPPAAPAVPKPPALAGAPQPGSIWPLITVLTVLVAIGILLVMYFALKH
jgi:hypothetical protein